MAIVNMVTDTAATVVCSTFVKINSASTGKIAKCTGSTDQPIGIATIGGAPGANVTVATAGEICALVAGSGGWTAGVMLKTDSSGQGVAVSSSSDIAGAVALTTVAAGAVGLVVVLAPSAGSGSSGTLANLSGAQTFSGAKSFSAPISLASGGHILTAQTTAPAVTLGPAAGTTGATGYATGGTDTAGLLTVGFTGGASTAGILATVSFRGGTGQTGAWPAAPKAVILTPGSTGAASLVPGTNNIWVDTLAPTGWNLNAGATMAVGTYSWYYTVIG